MVETGLQRHTEVAEVLLVPLEHPLEQVVLLRVPGYRLPDLVRRQVAPGGQEAHDKTEQPLGLALRHGPSKPLRVAPGYCLARSAAPYLSRPSVSCAA